MFQRSTLHLKWDEQSEFYGLEVDMRRLSIGMAGQAAELGDNWNVRDPGGADKAINDMCDLFMGVPGEPDRPRNLLSWNFGDVDGNPVAVDDRDAFKREVDPAMLFAILNAWLDLATAVAPPLPDGSGSTPPPPEPGETTAPELLSR